MFNLIVSSGGDYSHTVHIGMANVVSALTFIMNSVLKIHSKMKRDWNISSTPESL